MQVAVEPKALVVYSRLHAGCELIVQDSSCLCAEGEELSFLTLQLRAQSVGQVCPDSSRTSLISAVPQEQGWMGILLFHVSRLDPAAHEQQQADITVCLQMK